jgi:hypothetical protein
VERVCAPSGCAAALPCGGLVPPDARVGVAVRLVEDGAPVDLARVRVSPTGAPAWTDARGVARLSLAPPAGGGAETFTFAAEGASASLRVQWTSVSLEATPARLDVPGTDAAPLSFVASDDLGAPLAGVVVEVAAGGGSATSAPSGSTGVAAVPVPWTGAWSERAAALDVDACGLPLADPGVGADVAWSVPAPPAVAPHAAVAVPSAPRMPSSPPAPSAASSIVAPASPTPAPVSVPTAASPAQPLEETSTPSPTTPQPPTAMPTAAFQLQSFVVTPDAGGAPGLVHVAGIARGVRSASAELLAPDGRIVATGPLTIDADAFRGDVAAPPGASGDRVILRFVTMDGAVVTQDAGAVAPPSAASAKTPAPGPAALLAAGFAAALVLRAKR